MNEKELEKICQSEDSIHLADKEAEKEKEFAQPVEDSIHLADKEAEKEKEFAQPVEDSIHLADKEAEKEKEFAQLKEAHLRLMAEYDNYRKRTIKEKADLITNGGERVLVGLLSIIDDLERASKNIENTTQIETLKEGVDLICRKFFSFLQKNGIKAISSIGESFNSDLFEAIATVPAQNEEQKGKIVDNVQTGYMLNNKVIRHAKVIVAN